MTSEEKLSIFQYDKPETLPNRGKTFAKGSSGKRGQLKQTSERAAREREGFEHEYRLVMMRMPSVKYGHVV